ncbi:matrix-remodeling-associated protein 7-like isoform X2 [Dunckerocampus dactyliophorus]|uniref:matrix-remodeling-associated protein 7-like isoform X2 n=1 Tax=Dunckerocampus dactyliophorus TaxID=161453 RepID=UPI00240641DA|nr:matrix-remodeling-associated protein 7-like isoform X2 [Dunckerocampus dactyliophorus]
MDPTFILSAVIFTLLALVVATSLLNGSQDPLNGRSYPVPGEPAAKQNGHVPDTKQSKKKAVDDWCELSGSSHDHWDVVKSVQSEEAPPVPASEQPAPERSSSSASSLSVPRPDSRHTSFDSSSEASLGRGRRSFIGLSDQELLKCAFSHSQTEGAAESPEVIDKTDCNTNNSFQYVPGKSRSHHMEMMMSKEELEEEQRVQREQLAAIFQLLRDNTETFGEVSEGDMEEQLRLYSI